MLADLICVPDPRCDEVTLLDWLTYASLWVKYEVGPLGLAAVFALAAVLAAFGIVAPRVIRGRTDG